MGSEMVIVQDESYGRRVARLRREKGLNQKELAEQAGLPLRTLQDVEADKAKRPHRATKLALNRVLDIEGSADETREAWPIEVQVFLDIMGAFLSAMPESERLSKIRELTSHVVGSR